MVSNILSLDEDAIIHSRITNDERVLRRVVKKFSNYTTVAWKCSIGCLSSGPRAEPDSPLASLPPTSGQQRNGVLNRTYIHVLFDDVLLQIFRWYRLEEGNNWNLRYTWRTLTHICRKWRNLIYGSWSYLDMCLLLTNNSPSIDTLIHLPPLPLVIDYSDRTRTVSQKDEDNIRFGLQQHGRLRRVVLRAPYSSLRMWLEPMNNPFPRLRDLSLSSTTVEKTNPMFPETLQAPDLRRLSLHGITLSTESPLLSSTIALSKLSLTCIGASSYFPPEHLVTQLQCLPHLEELSIDFAFSKSLPGIERDRLLAPNPPMTLPALRRFIFGGEDVYLDNLVAQINTPLLEQLTLTLLFDFTYTIVNLAEFICRDEGSQCIIAKVIFNRDTASIDVGHYEQQGIGKLSLRINCKPFDWKIDSATQVCSALGKFLSVVEMLTIDLDVDGMPSDWENTLDSTVWHELLLPFVGVNKLRIGSSLTRELSKALESVSGGLVPELLPALQEFEVQLRIDHAKTAFSGFIKTRESVGRPVRLLAPPVPLVEPETRRAAPSRRSLTSTVKQVLADHPKFRILVVGKRGSGKSSLINATFRVDISAALARSPDIDFEFRPDDNRHLIVHECSGLELGDADGLRAILEFISDRIDPSRPAPERLHAIWICIPTYDAQNGNIGEGVDEILNMRRVPVVVAFTKSDESFPQITGSESGSSQYQDRTRSKAYAQCGQLCRPLFRREPSDVPAELVSVMPQFSALINNLIMTTDRLIMGSHTVSTSSARSSTQGTNLRIAPTPLVWSVALRGSRDITIQTSIEIGRSRYWRNLRSSLDFVDQPLKNCVNIIHIDIVEIWNLYDKSGYLSNNQFKISMSHIVEDLAVLAGGASSSRDWIGSGDKFADWVYDVYQGSLENVQCVMGYIINLTVILDGIFKTTAGNVTENAVRKVTDSHIRSGRRDSIHRDIRSFVTLTFAIRFAVPQRDLVLDMIIDLIKQYCAPFLTDVGLSSL